MQMSESLLGSLEHARGKLRAGLARLPLSWPPTGADPPRTKAADLCDLRVNLRVFCGENTNTKNTKVPLRAQRARLELGKARSERAVFSLTAPTERKFLSVMNRILTISAKAGRPRTKESPVRRGVSRTGRHDAADVQGAEWRFPDGLFGRRGEETRVGGRNGEQSMAINLKMPELREL